MHILVFQPVLCQRSAEIQLTKVPNNSRMLNFFNLTTQFPCLFKQDLVGFLRTLRHLRVNMELRINVLEVM